MNPDILNGLFELGGATALAWNVRVLYRDKVVRGVHWLPTLFFAVWGLWNLFYYPSLEQWFSVAGGAAVVMVNIVWLVLMMYYNHREKRGVKYMTIRTGPTPVRRRPLGSKPLKSTVRRERIDEWPGRGHNPVYDWASDKEDLNG